MTVQALACHPLILQADRLASNGVRCLCIHGFTLAGVKLTKEQQSVRSSRVLQKDGLQLYQLMRWHAAMFNKMTVV